MAPKVSVKAVKKAGRPAAKVNEDGTKKKTKRKRKESYDINFDFLQVQPDAGVSSKAMSIMNSFVNDLFDRITLDSVHLAHTNERSTNISREIQTSVRMLGELAKQAVDEGTKFMTENISSN